MNQRGRYLDMALRRWTKKGMDKRKLDVERTKRLHEWFKDIWGKRAHYSEVSGKWLGHEPLTTMFHHIYPKSKYPDLEFEEDNIILLTADEHGNVENDIYVFEEVNIRRQELKEKYNI